MDGVGERVKNRLAVRGAKDAKDLGTWMERGKEFNGKNGMIENEDSGSS